MKTLCSIIFVLIFLSGKLAAQPELRDSVPFNDSIRSAKNLVYVELLGNSGLYSLNYERILVDFPGFKMMSRAGAGWWMTDRHPAQSYLLEENFCIGRNGKFIELGFGITMQRKLLQDCTDSIKFSYENLYWGIFRAGLRFQPKEKGSVFRIGLTPVLYYKDKCETDFPYFQFFGGISYGIVF